MQIAEEWADVGVGCVGRAHVVRRRATQAVTSENCVDRLLLDEGAARQREIGPRGHREDGGRKGNARIPQGECRGDSEASSCRLAGESDVLRLNPLREKCLIGGPCVVDRSRKRVLGRKTVVEDYDLGARALGEFGAICGIDGCFSPGSSVILPLCRVRS